MTPLPDTDRIPIAGLVVSHLPETPGVYQFLAADGTILYIGKSRSLRSRIRQYLSGQDERPNVPFLLQEAHFLRLIAVGSEKEALILENRLVKKYRPRYNVDLKDDKSYPYLAITAERYPQLVVTRMPWRKYLFIRGPFTDVKLLRSFRRALLAAWPLRRCVSMPKKACINYQLGLCPAPCEGRISPEEYRARIEAVKMVIEGRSWQDFSGELALRIEADARKLLFERAAQLRDILKLIPDLKKNFGIETGRVSREDHCYFSFEAGSLFLTVGEYESGELTGLYHFRKPNDEEDISSAVAAALTSFYEFRAVPGALGLYPEELLDAGLISDLLEKPIRRAAMSPSVRTLLAQNHTFAKERWRRIGKTDVVDTLCDLAGKDVSSILCLDISTFYGNHTVAGAVWWERGRFVRANYRRFLMRTIVGTDDFGSITEAVFRLAQHWACGEWPQPSLLLIDGGPTQVRAALKGTPEGLPVVGIIKDRKKDRGGERLVTADGDEIALDSCPDALTIASIRDETHRYSITSNRNAREKDFRSLFPDITGLGTTREKKILAHFGTAENVRKASLEELKTVPGLPIRIAEALFERLHSGY